MGIFWQKPTEKTLAVAARPRPGRLIFIAVPMGLGIKRTAYPRLAAEYCVISAPGLLPIRVNRDVEWAINRLGDGGWLVTPS